MEGWYAVLKTMTLYNIPVAVLELVLETETADDPLYYPTDIALFLSAVMSSMFEWCHYPTSYPPLGQGILARVLAMSTGESIHYYNYSNQLLYWGTIDIFFKL